jgi:Tfp pilus assembly protein FimT
VRKSLFRENRRGFALVELLGMLVILAAVSLLVGHLVVMLMRTTRTTAERDTMIARVDGAMDQLRRDAWEATAFRASGDSVEITTSSGKIVWTANGADLTRTVAGERGRVWKELPRVEFAAGSTPAMLVVSVDSGVGGSVRRETLTLASQRLLAGGVP